MDRTLLYVTAAAIAIAASGAVRVWLRRRKTPEQRERERRERLVATGRIIDGTILDVHEVPSAAGALQLLVYRYDVRGVAYEASQDVTHLRQYLDLHSCRIGVPAAVKYDPQNPGDSIVIAEGWSGLRN
jgi:hypothetical protein